MNAHLTPDQIDEYLTDPQAAPAVHVDGCAACRSEVARFRAGMASFNAATLAWAEARSATLPAQGAKPAAGAWRPLAWRPLAWSASAIACLAMAFTAFHPGAAKAPPASQIASDNQLLLNIDRAVDAPVASPAGLFDPSLSTEVVAQ